MVNVKLTDCSPAEFFRWRLENKDKHGLAELMDLNFRYAVRLEEISYVWDNYNARIEPVLHHAKSKGPVLEVGSGFGTELLYLALRGVDSWQSDIAAFLRSLYLDRLQDSLSVTTSFQFLETA